jgi:hypothetical protein
MVAPASAHKGQSRESGGAAHVQKSVGMNSTTEQSQVDRETPGVSAFAAIHISNKQRSVRFLDKVDASATPPLSPLAGPTLRRASADSAIEQEARNISASSASTSAAHQPHPRIDTRHQTYRQPHYSTSPSTTQSSRVTPPPFTVTQSSGSVGVPVMLSTLPSQTLGAEGSVCASEVRRSLLSETASVAASTVEIE